MATRERVLTLYSGRKRARTQASTTSQTTRCCQSAIASLHYPSYKPSILLPSHFSLLSTSLLIGPSSILFGHEGSVGGGRALLEVLLDEVGVLGRRHGPVVLLGEEAKVHDACGRRAVARVVLTGGDVLAESAACSTRSAREGAVAIFRRALSSPRSVRKAASTGGSFDHEGDHEGGKSDKGREGALGDKSVLSEHGFARWCCGVGR